MRCKKTGMHSRFHQQPTHSCLSFRAENVSDYLCHLLLNRLIRLRNPPLIPHDIKRLHRPAHIPILRHSKILGAVSRCQSHNILFQHLVEFRRQIPLFYHGNPVIIYAQSVRIQHGLEVIGRVRPGSTRSPHLFSRLQPSLFLPDGIPPPARRP